MTISQTGFKRDIVGSYITKDPAATLQYAVDWSEWLPTGDTIATTAWVQESVHTNGNLVLSGSATANGVNTIDIAGGTDGELYTVKNTITTNENLTDVRRFRIKVEKRYL